MQEVAEILYSQISKLPRFTHESPRSEIPPNGVYFFFERGESVTLNGCVLDRITRVGSHRADGRLPDRIRQHFSGNKNGSIFRRHLGAALLVQSKAEDPPLEEWLKTKGSRYPQFEPVVSKRLQLNFSFSCIEVPSVEDRKVFESGIIALLANSSMGTPTSNWLGNYAVNVSIPRSGLWNIQFMDAEPLSLDKLYDLSDLIAKGLSR